MFHRKPEIFIALFFGLFSASAYTDCGLPPASVRVLSDDFPALQAVTDGALECASDTVDITLNVTSEHKQIMVPALSVIPAGFTVVTVANGSLMPLVNEGLVQPLNDYVERYGSDLLTRQLITIDDQVLAIAFMVNAQHLFYRQDVLDQVGLAVPTTWSEVLHAASVIRERGIMRYPLSGSFGSGWHLAQEFVNLYLGYGGEFFKPQSAEPAVNSEAGTQTLALMKRIADYMPPDFLTFDVTDVQTQWEDGEVAMANLWGSRAGSVLDAEGASSAVIEATGFAAAPGIEGKSTSASTLWWVGFSVAKNIPQADAEASFRAMLHASSTEIANQHNTLAAWLVRDARTSPESKGVIATARKDAPPYPTQPWMTLMHRALGQEIVDFLLGRESAEQALIDVESAYRTAAQESGFL